MSKTSELFDEIMGVVGPGGGTDYINLSFKVDERGYVTIEGNAPDKRVLDEYINKIASVPGVNTVNFPNVTIHDGA